MRKLWETALIILLFTLIALGIMYFVKMAHSAESDLPAQEVAEKFVISIYNKDFKEAARLLKSSDNPENYLKNIEKLRQSYVNVDKQLREWYKSSENLELKTIVIEPSTLISFRRGTENNFNKVSVILTERREMISGKQKWLFFYHVEYIILVNNENLITASGFVDNKKWREPMMILKPEDCIKPAICD